MKNKVETTNYFNITDKNVFNMIKYIENIFFKTGIINKDTKVVVAFSGGRDSVCLFDILLRIKNKYDFNLEAIHINHNIRGEEADRDQEFVNDVCSTNNIVLHNKSVESILYSNQNKISVEEAARILRYREFEKIVLNNDKKNIFIALAHHKNDQVETVMHNMLRGTGLKGIAAMTEIRDKYLRPILSFTRDEVDNYIKYFDLSFVDDSTNQIDDYTRNNIRHNLIPMMNDINQQAVSHIYNLSMWTKEAVEIIEDISINKFDECKIIDNEKLVLDCLIFNQNKKIIKFEIIKRVFEYLNISKKDISKSHMEEIVKLSESIDGGHLDLPYNIDIDKKHNKMTFTKK